MSKKANGEGSIYQRKSDGRWSASISLPNGKRKHFLSKNRDEVARQLRAALKGQDEGSRSLPNARQSRSSCSDG